LECHNAEDAKGGLVMDSYQNLQKGGDNGPVITAGEPDKSRLVLLPEGKAKPPMPPKKAKQPKPSEVAVLRAWVAAGAKDDTATITLQLPEIKPHMQAAPPIAALAYRPDGKLLAVGAHKAVMMVDLATDDVMGQFAAHPGRVTALAFSRDGRRLAVASSSPGTAGDVFLYALAKTVTENGAIALKTA